MSKQGGTPLLVVSRQGFACQVAPAVTWAAALQCRGRDHGSSIPVVRTGPPAPVGKGITRGERFHELEKPVVSDILHHVGDRIDPEPECAFKDATTAESPLWMQTRLCICRGAWTHSRACAS